MIMAKKLYRQKSLDQVSSPEELNDYIRVTRPSIWLILLALVLLLLGMLAYFVFGTVDVNNVDGETETVHPITFIIN